LAADNWNGHPVSSRHGRRLPDIFNLCLIYDYTVNGVGYSSSRVHFGTPTTYIRKSSAEAAISHYPVDSHSTVYYDPENPAEAVLDRTSPGGLEYIIIGIMLLVLPALVIIYPAHTTTATNPKKGPLALHHALAMDHRASLHLSLSLGARHRSG
jgi:hypothetical protein